MSTVVNSSDVLRVWPHLQTADGATLMLEPGESAEVELPEGFSDPYLEIDGTPAPEPDADPPAEPAQPSPPVEPDPEPTVTEIELPVVTDADGEGWETIPHPLETVTITAPPQSGTASLEPVENQPDETCVKVVNATASSTQTVHLHITN